MSSNATEEQKRNVSNWLGVKLAENPGTYLGIPSLWGKTRKEVLAVLKDRILDKLQGWNQKLLSQGGREILIKAVVSAIPIYMMSSFKCPKSFCTEINAAASRFWWGKLK